MHRARFCQWLAQVLAVLWLCASSASISAQAPILSAAQALHAVRGQELLLIDVRSPAEWQTTGLPAGAQPITIHQAGGARAFYDAVLAAVGGDKNRPLGLICASGVRSDRAQRILAGGGFTQVFNVAEGMEGSQFGPGWRRRGLPTEPWPQQK